MFTKKLFPVITGCLAAMALLVTSCGSQDPSSQPVTNAGSNTAGKYDPPITLTVCRFLGPQVKYAEGEDIENNIWTKVYLDRLGIKIKYTFTSPDFQTFDTKVNMAIASNSLPDIVPLYTTLFFRAADSGRFADLTDVYNKFASKELRDLQESNDIVRKTCTVNGKLVALGGPPSSKYGGMLSIRTDWLKKLNLEPPQNMDDVINIAKAFATKDPDGDGEPNFGLALDKNLGGTTGFFNGYHAYHNIWIEKNGRLERGEVQPEMKTALSKLAELYKAGVIDEEFVLKTDQDLREDFASQALGMTYGVGSVEESVKSNPEATWGLFPIVSCDDKPALAQTETRVGAFISVGSQCKYPEALIKMANMEIAMKNDPKTPREYHDKDGIETFWYALVSVYSALLDPEYNFDCADLVSEAINTGDTSKLNAEQLGYYTRCKEWIDNKNTDCWAIWNAFGPGGAFQTSRAHAKKGLVYPNKGWGPETPAWREYGPNLYYKCAEEFTTIIIGEKPIEEFDNWVKYFYANGGQKATDEINEWYQKNK